MLQKNKIQLLIVIFLGLSFQTAYGVSTSAEVKEYFCKLYEDKSGEMISGNYSYSEEEVSDAKDFVQGKVGDENYLDLYINDEISESELIEELIKLCIPAFVVFGIALLCTILCGVRWILACCCCCCCKKNKEKYIEKGEEIKISKFRYGLPMVINIIGFIMLIVCSIIGIIRGLKFFNGYYMAQCQISSFFDDFNAENTEEDWVGLIKLSRILKEVQSDFITEVNNAFGGTAGDFIQDDYTDLTNLNNALEPTSSVYQYSDGTNNFDSTFYTARYGPKTVDGSHLYVIDKIVVDGVSVLRDSLQEVQDSGESILGGDGGASFTQTLKDGDEQIQDFIKQIDDSSVDFYDSGTSIDDSTLDLAEQGIAAYFGVCLLFGLISTVSGICVLYKKKYCCNIFLCFGAIFQVIFGLVGAILLAVFYATVQASLMACDYSFQVISEYPKFQELDLGEDINTKVKICSAQYGGDGNIVAEFNIEDQINNLKELTQNINDSISTFSEQKETFDDADATFQEALDNLDQLIETFAYTDFDGSEQTDISTDLNNEIDLSNKHEDFCTGYSTYFVYDDDDCTKTLDNLYMISDNDFTPTIDRCYNLNEYNNRDWQNDGTYVLERSDTNCFGNSVTGLDVTMDIIGVKNQYSTDNQDDVDGLKTAVSNYYNVESQNYIDGIQTMSNNIDSLLNDIEVLTGVDDGSAGNLNCLFVGQAISDINSAMCVDTIPDMYWFSITLLCNSIAIIISYFGAICARFRFQEKEIDEKINKKIKKNENKQQQMPANQQYDQNYTKY